MTRLKAWLGSIPEKSMTGTVGVAMMVTGALCGIRKSNGAIKFR
jgi:hypothetical protein